MDVSVVVPTRNRSALLAMTLRSVLGQQDVDFEVIVVDEASTDDTPALLAGLHDARLRVIRHDVPHGLPAARNRGAAEARGDWLAFVDDDDLWAPTKLVRQVRQADEVGRDWVYAGAVNIVDGRVIYGEAPLPPDQVVAALPRYNPIPGGGSNVIIRRSMWLCAGPFDMRFQGGGEDWEMSIRLARRGLPACVCSPLVAKRLHSTNMTLDIAQTMSAAQLIEALHHIQVDWGRMDRWLAHSCLRAGRRRAALSLFARAAVRGQLRGVGADMVPILQRRFPRLVPKPADATELAPVWQATAAAWLNEFEVTR
jgi:GT2 family glycosyltransferase